MVPAQYHNFRDVFSKEAFDQLPPWKAWDHAIDLSPATELPHSRTSPLPLISNVLTCVHNAKFFTVLNLRWGFNNVWIKEGDDWKAAFQTNQGLFEPTIMFFGLCNSPMTFQMMMNNIL